MAEMHLFMYFQDDSHPPSWICFSLFWTTIDIPFDELYFSCQWHNALIRCDFMTSRIWVESACLGQFLAVLGVLQLNKHQLSQSFVDKLAVSMSQYLPVR